MAIEFVNDPVALVRDYNAFVFGANVPEVAKDRLQTIPGSAADVITQGRELLYAHYDLLDDEGKAVLAKLAQYAVMQNWVAENADGRAEKITAAVRRDLGERGTWPDAADDPAPNVALRAAEPATPAPVVEPTP